MQSTSERKRMKVLVVDDTSTNRQILQVFLSRLNVLVVTADDGAQGVAAFEREQPDLVIMDVMMPVMDGYEATRRIKALAGERWAPVIFLSALDKEENLVAGLDAGGDDYLHKPVNFVVLAAKIRSVSRALMMQRALYDERQRIAAITDNLVDGVVAINDSGMIQWCNPAVENIFGYSQQEMIGHNVNMLMPEPHRSQHDAYLLRYLNGGMPRVIGVGQRNMLGVRRNGEVFPLDLGISEMRVAGSRQFVGVIRDTTERESAAEQLRENADRLQRYHDAQEAESALAQKIVNRQMQREGLQDAAVSYWLGPNANFSGDVVAATRDASGNLYVLLADATGHGLGAAICTLPVLSLFYSLSQTGTALAEIVQEVNRQLRATLPVGYFVAIAMLRLQADGRYADVWLGGVPDMLLLGESGRLKRRFSSANLPLGIDHMELSEIAVERVEVREDDQFILFSDGLIEAANTQGNPFGYDLLLSSLAAQPSPPQRVEAVRAALTRHLAGCAAHDDISMMAISCAPYARAG